MLGPQSQPVDVHAKGHNGQVHFDGVYVTITRKGFLARTSVGKGEKRIPLTAISAVQWKPPGALVNGFAADDPDAFLPDLAASLNNLSNRLGSLGRREPALTAVEEAVSIHRELAAARPDAFLPNLATSLNNRSVRLGELGRREPALAAIEEAVEAYRELAARWPDAHQHELDQSVEVLAWLKSLEDEP
jgi:tetratricopeptide (TPR) repeat protein